MSEPIQLEWEPAEWPEKQPKWAGRERHTRLRGMSACIRAMAIGDVVRVQTPPQVDPKAVAARLHTAAQRAPISGKIVTRQIGEHIYVRRVE